MRPEPYDKGSSQDEKASENIGPEPYDIGSSEMRKLAKA